MINLQTEATDIRTQHHRLALQWGRTCAARPYGRSDRHPHPTSSFGVAMGTAAWCDSFEGVAVTGLDGHIHFFNTTEEWPDNQDLGGDFDLSPAIIWSQEQRGKEPPRADEQHVV